MQRAGAMEALGVWGGRMPSSKAKVRATNKARVLPAKVVLTQALVQTHRPVQMPAKVEGGEKTAACSLRVTCKPLKICRLPVTGTLGLHLA